MQVETMIDDPLGWINDDYGVWNLIADYSNKEKYGRLDNIYRCLVDGIPKEELGFQNKTVKELKDEYSREFPLLIAHAFESIAEDIKNGELVIKTNYLDE